MELRGALADLPRDDIEWQEGLQALSKALAAWRAEPAVAPVLAAMKRFGAGGPWERAQALALLFGPADGRAQAFAASLVAAGLAALDGHPLGQLPLRHGSVDAASMLLLAQSGAARLMLTAYDGAALATLPAACTVRLRPVEAWQRVLSGSGLADHVRHGGGGSGGGSGGGALRVDTVRLGPGEASFRHGPDEALEVRGVEGTMVVLRLERRVDDHGPVREVRLCDGALVHQSGARKDDSRAELAVALLGRMARIDAVPEMAGVALGGGGNALRWQALCEVLVLDGLAGMELLAQVAADPQDPLQGQAAALLAMLLAARPELVEAGTWPA